MSGSLFYVEIGETRLRRKYKLRAVLGSSPDGLDLRNLFILSSETLSVIEDEIRISERRETGFTCSSFSVGEVGD